MNGKLPVRSEYTTPENLSANAAEQNIFAVEESSSSTITFGSLTSCGTKSAGAGITTTGALSSMGSTCITSSRGITGIAGAGVALGGAGRRVLLIPWRGLFMWPFAVAGLGLRYFKISFSVMLGQPRRNPRRTALSSVEIVGLHNDWCANFTPFPRVRME